MAQRPPIRRIVVGVDGSAHAAEALEWAIKLAQPADAEILAVLAIRTPSYLEWGGGVGPPRTPPERDPRWRAKVRRSLERDWSRALRDSGVRFRTIMEDGRAASVIAAVAEREGADLVVVGRRGRSGVAEMLLGSVSHELSHHCICPVLVVSHRPAAHMKSQTDRGRRSGMETAALGFPSMDSPRSGD
jgi:nucleotide-binding universal stress UspA family protein